MDPKQSESGEPTPIGQSIGEVAESLGEGREVVNRIKAKAEEEANREGPSIEERVKLAGEVVRRDPDDQRYDPDAEEAKLYDPTTGELPEHGTVDQP